MSPAATDFPQPLIALLEKQQALVERLAALARAQAALIAERRTDRLLELLAQRQSIIDEFTASQQEMAALTQRIGGRLSDLAQPLRQRIRTLIDAIGERLNEIMHRDQQDQSTLRGEREHVRHELQHVTAGRAARSAYAGAPSTTSSAAPPSTPDTARFADHKG